MIQLIMALALSNGAAAESPSEMVQFILEGQPPQLTATQFAHQSAALRRQISNVRDQLVLTEEGSSCRRFRGALDETLSQLDKTLVPKTLQSVSPADTFRQRLLIQAFFALQVLIVNGAEASFGTLDGVSAACPWVNREPLIAEIKALAQNAAKFTREGLGSPGLNTLDAINLSLLQQARQSEYEHNRNEWIIIGGAAVASIIIWNYGPVVAGMAARQLFGAIPVIMEKPVFAFALRTGVLSLEGLGVHAVQQTWNAPEVIHPPDALPSWDQQMSEIERLLESEDTPQLQLFYVSLIRGQLAQLYGPWLESNARELQTDPRWQELTALVTEAMLLEGRTIPEAVIRMQSLFQTNYGYTVTCETGILDGLSSFLCERGLQTFARALYADEIPSRPPQGEILDVHFSNDPQVETWEANDGVQVRFSADVSRRDLAASVQAALASKMAAKHLRQAQQLAAVVEDLQKKLPLILAFDESLSRNEKWEAVNAIATVYGKNPGLFKRDSEMLLIQAGYSGQIYERGGILTENINAAASARQMEAFLVQRLRGAPGYLDLIQNWRNQSRILKAEMSRRYEMNARCKDSVSAIQCLQALIKLDRFLLNHFHKFNPGTREFIVTAANEMGRMLEYENAHTPFAAIYFREDFKVEDMNQFAGELGWLQDWTSGG